ncbi:tRNA (adenine(58)-N(1))-methyltransferase non-catalytic subunit trm6 [Chlorella sorokiniana]|uniref:tRNA (adenine(58)-N(1))-methyltransferase non-catalytic subunit TRM6 n=1 Tax=Chlorella sorokiniana TaxID=3076 RepID=A0A2P6U448_CHLSO|nr:tRNA (adenine(58)-N(1))-methyltransferase non-catalytic subunit trm6 [Chlorella sorokiniana]|eukprot:PRW61100.1 tRNA (adenine(58)-N(1))-methyltransferase non-catalytic subunit trm6 [Chlorella sorokiniana]
MAAAAAAVAAPAAPGPVVREGDTVIWDVNGDKQALVAVDGRSRVKLGTAFFSAAPLLGCPYGSMFTLSADGSTLERTQYTPLPDWDLPDDKPDFNTRTNDKLVQNDANQTLSAAEIEAMKASGAAGADIVAALAANSATFAAKTEFSQEKYKKKKAKKYIQIATVRRPTGATVAEAYFANSPAKTNYLRADTLALLLTLANVGAHARVLVVESCGGLVSAAALERTGGGVSPGSGVASAWAGGPTAKKPSLEIWRSFNFSQQQRAGLRFAPLSTLLEEARQAQQAAQQAGNGQQQDGQRQPQEAVQQDGPAAAGDAAEPMQQDGQPHGSEQQQQAEQPPGREDAQQQTAGGAAAAGGPRPPFDSCILAAPGISPLALVQHVLPLLAPSASLAVYSPWAQPLAEALDALRGQGQVANLALSEAWWRELQVLPLRTHPTMNMNHGGGYILSATVLAHR